MRTQQFPPNCQMMNFLPEGRGAWGGAGGRGVLPLRGDEEDEGEVKQGASLGCTQPYLKPHRGGRKDFISLTKSFQEQR